jgi:hypothetical protein
MKSILEALYAGRIAPFETIFPKNPEYLQLGRKITTNTAEWRKKLSEDDYQSLDALLELCGEIRTLESGATFDYGFRLGAMLMLEVLTGRDELVDGD